MGAGIHRWWRDLTRECEEYGEREYGEPIARALNDDGIEIRLRTYDNRPRWYGIIDLTDGKKHTVS